MSFVDNDGPSAFAADSSATAGAFYFTDSLRRAVLRVDFVDADFVGNLTGDEIRNRRLAGTTLARQENRPSTDSTSGDSLNLADGLVLTDHVGPVFRPVLFV